MPLQQTVKHAIFSALSAADSVVHPPTAALHDIRQFLLLQYPSALGSAVHATPLIPALHAAVPDAEITVCASGFALEIFRNNPGVHRLVHTPDPTAHLWSAARAIRQALPPPPFATITSNFNGRSTIALAALLSGAVNRVGFTLAPELYRVALQYEQPLSQIANNLRIIAALGHPPSAHHDPQVFFPADDLAHARTLLTRFDDSTRPLVAFVTQTSPTQRKSWPADRFAAAAHALIAEHNANIVLIGSSSERPKVEAIRQIIGTRAINVAGETNLPQLAAMLSLCAVGLTLDTGTMHVGRAVGLPMVIVAPAWSPPVEWLPLHDSRFIILKNLDLPAAPPDYIIDEVSVQEVIAALNQLLCVPR